MAERTVLVRLKANASDFNKAMVGARAAVTGLRDEIDTTNDRTAWLAQSLLALGPTLSPLGAAAVPVLSGLATQMVLLGGAAGTAALAFTGVGDALGAVNDYQLEPTAENLSKMNLAMEKLSGDGQEFVRFLDSVGPAFSVLQDDAQAGMFPGMIEGIESMVDLLPRVRPIVSGIAEAMGELASASGAGLAGDGFRDFFDYLASDAQPLLVELGNTIGNVAEGLAGMLVAFSPASADFSSGLEDMTARFAEWSHTLADDSTFQDFLAYIEQSGPKALDLFGSMVDAFVSLAQAAAPVGDVMVPALSALFDVLSAFLDTPLGPLFLAAAAAMSVYGRAVALASITTGGLVKTVMAVPVANAKAATSFTGLGAALNVYARNALTAGAASERMAAGTALAGGRIGAQGKAMASTAAMAGLFAVSMSDIDDSMGLTNTTMGAMLGLMAGPWGAAVGAGAGLLLDIRAGADEATKGLQGLDAAVESGNMDALVAKIAQAKAELDDLNSTDGFKDRVSDSFASAAAAEGFLGTTSAAKVYARELAAAEAKLVELKRAEAAAAGDKSFYNSLVAETAALEENIQKMRTKREEALRGSNAMLNYQSALLDVRDAAKENSDVLGRNGQLLQGQKRAGIEALSALNNMAAAWNGLNDKAQNAPGAFRGAIDSFVDAAKQMGIGRERARQMAAAIFNIPTKHETQISMEVDVAIQRARAIKAELASIDRNIDVYVNVRRPNADGFGPQVTSSAAGGSVPKTGLPYADRHMYLLADGEEVTSNRRGQADRYRSVLKGINSDLPRHIIKGMLAEGGTAGGGKRRKRGLEQEGEGGYDLSSLIAATDAQIEAASMQIDAAKRAALAAKDQDEAADKALAAAQQLYDGVQSQVAGLFKIDPLAKPSSAWGQGGDPFAALADVTNRANAFSANSTAIAGRGLDGAALAYGMESESNLARLGAMSDADLQKFEDMYNAAVAAVGVAATTGADLAYGQQVAQATASAAGTEAALGAVNAHLADVSQKFDVLSARLTEYQAASIEQRKAAAEVVGNAAAGGIVRGGNAVARRGNRG